ncbi:MAG: nucleoside-triphosphatase [Candidatus Aminicenantales bacterium]|jgi:nucleoside-triphosphatase THEP1
MIVILTGGVGSGKTAFLTGLLKVLRSRSLPLDGFVAERVFHDRRLTGYDLAAVRDGRRFPFLRRGERTGGATIGPWLSAASGLAAAAEIIRASDPGAILVIDELGPLELEGRGHWPALAAVLDQPGRRFLFVIREGCLIRFIRLFEGRAVKIHPVRAKMDGGAIVEELASDGRND